MAYSIDSSTEDCYEGTTCLINKLGIRDEKLLEETEGAYTLGKASLLELQPLEGSFDFAHYKRIHYFLFCDLYEWAGKVRTVNLSKKGTAFVPADEIEQCAEACFSRMAQIDFSALSRKEAVAEIADFYNTLNMLHPFREGNGRTQRIFFTQWIRHLGYDIDLSQMDADVLMIATIHGAQGVLDDLLSFFDEMLIEPRQEYNMDLAF